MPDFDVQKIRDQFPILQRKIHAHDLVYLDNAATTQKPRAVLDVLKKYYETENANIHRGVHTLSQEATALYEEAREKIARYINAPDPKQIIYTRSTTESINLVAASYGRKFLSPGDEILISAMEHHSNIVPWQFACEQTGAILRVIPINDAGELRMDEFEKLLNERTKIVSIVHLSNSLGTVNPVKQIIAKAHAAGAVVMIDGAQWVAHGPLDVVDLDADFYAFSGHKIYGPTGIGILYGKKNLLNAMPPYQGGGDMISSVTFEKTTYAGLPNKFEAGTPHIAGAIGLGAAIDFVNSIGLENIAKHEQQLLRYATEKLSAIPGLRIVGTAKEKAGAISFVIENPPISTLDLGTRLDAVGIAVRTGHHCCQPVMDRFAINSTARMSLAVYNTQSEIDALATALRQIISAESAKPARPAQSATIKQEIVFPTRAAASPIAAAEELIDTFDALGDWEQRHEYLVELGDKLPLMPVELKTESNRVRGCMSLVHLVARHRPGTPDTLDFLADSDAAIVRGLIAILQEVYSGQRAGDILAFDITALLKRLGLDEHLSMGRRNGLASMIQRIGAEATQLSQKSARQTAPA
jgi:cysteine desulfurase/selenocysteine lyase